VNRQRKYTSWPLFFHTPPKVHLEVEPTNDTNSKKVKLVKLLQRVFGYPEAICVNIVFQAAPYSLPGLIWGILHEQIVLANFAGQQNRLTPSESPPGIASENERRRIPQTRSAQSHAKHPHHLRHRPNQQRHHRPPSRPLQPHRLHRRPGQRLFQIRKHLPFIKSPVGSQRRRPPLVFAPQGAPVGWHHRPDWASCPTT
jgi:hypothetical protein